MPVNLKNYKNIFYGSGVISAFGCIAYETYRFKNAINSIVQPNVLYIDNKGPEYIYIKYHIYRESLKQMKEYEEERNNIINVVVHPISKWWKAMEHSIAWRLLAIAQNGNEKGRLQAIRKLVVIDHLKEWDFQHLAQLCDARTAVSLARSGCDIRWFLKPKMLKVLKNPQAQLYDIQKLLDDMLLDRPCKCIEYFLNGTFRAHDIKEPQTDDLFVSHGEPIKTHDLELLRKCVDEFLHLSNDVRNSQEIIKRGGLMILLELYKIFSNDPIVKQLMCQIISNLSLCYDKIYDFFVTGWVRIIAEWTHDQDLSIKCLAAKALANLDRDDPNNFIYNHKVVPLYPIHRIDRQPEMDVVFIHGILGSVFYTWRQRDHLELLNSNYSNAANGEAKKLKDNLRSNRLETIKSMSDQEAKVNLLTNDSTSTVDSSEGVISNKITDFYKEIIQSLDGEGELTSEWEVVYPDCPLKSEAASFDEAYSVDGTQWLNEDHNGTERTKCWPMEWLPGDFPNIRIIGCNYESNISYWSQTINCACDLDKPNAQLLTRGREFLKYLIESGVGENNRPIVFVGHSMGGLIAKTIIMQSYESDDPKVRAIGENTRGILFLGTPHKGATVFKLSHQTQKFLFSPTLEVLEMAENAQHLLVLNEKFLKYLTEMEVTWKKPMNIVNIIEGLPTMLSTPFKRPYYIVTENSANLNRGDTYVLNEDHLGISKPIFKQSFLYQRLKKLIFDVLNDRDQGA